MIRRCPRTPALASLAALAALAAVGCGTAASSGDATGDRDAADTAADSASDLGVVDATPADAALDIGAPDTASDADTGGSFGAPCAAADDCDSGQCVAFGADDGFCSQMCTEDADCPRDYDCALISGDGADPVRVCLPGDLCVDMDDDGYGIGPGCRGPDCDDDGPDVNPAADERCNGVDDDCDDRIDDNPIDDGGPCVTAFEGACAAGVLVCDDGAPLCQGVAPPSPESCNGVDDDCDGLIDEGDDGAPLRRSCYDGDPARVGVGECVAGEQACAAGEFGGCFGQNTASAESCNGLDDDCDGDIDEGLALSRFWIDGDGDGAGDADSTFIEACAAPAGYVANDDDCDDTTDAVAPGRAEVPGDGVDANCDGVEFCFLDADNDGWRPSAVATAISADTDCDDDGEANAADPIGDCRDDDPAIHQGAVELPDDTIDSDCDGFELCYVDADDDGFRPDADSTVRSPNLVCSDRGEATASTPIDDCNDRDSDVFPGAIEFCDGADNDCNGLIDEGIACLELGEACVVDADCASGWCDAGFCADGSACQRPGSCPPRTGLVSGGGAVSSARFGGEITIGSPAPAAVVASPRFAGAIGTGSYVAGPR